MNAKPQSPAMPTISTGRHKVKPHDATQRTWSEWCLDQIGISDDTASRYIKCFQAVQASAKTIKADAAKKARRNNQPSAQKQ